MSILFTPLNPYASPNPGFDTWQMHNINSVEGMNAKSLGDRAFQSFSHGGGLKT